ncbi:hypothetical protein OQZ33_16145 [Pedobacter sp. MC2016-05]|uniref:hypothetical protein n=1 Tax=unclassified Pedobacter TaxID=2628915 RepID=UPI000AEE4C8E|nr:MULTISPECIES: hypothetical protein [unclassified Pedobacter]MCX2475864.1 hypothetical protein [Pedobacter sp. MC2016-05]RZK68215.1 MAG: hypothetical protein EOO95_00430 [Pedobacter sp.]
MCRKTTILIAFILTICTSDLMANKILSPGFQDTTRHYQPGKTYTFNVTAPSGEYALAIEYIAGDHKSKLILTSPHGGSLKPDFIRTRTNEYVVKAEDNGYGDTESFSAVSDSKTLELTQALAEEIKRTTGLRPHIILNHLHRSKLDANRAMSLAAQGDVNAEAAWKAFHAFIDDAKAQVLKNNEGLLFDIHGNAHRPQRTEIGLLLKGKDFKSNDLEQYADKSSVKAMVKSGKATMTELIKGDYAMGTLLSEKDILATPGKSVPNPVDEEFFPDGRYFNGGYNTARHGSKFSGNISAIQLEFNSDVRMDDKKRPEYVKSITKAINQFMAKYFK